MKKVYLLSVLFLFSLSLFAQKPFITTWETTTDKESITIPTTGEGYNYTVDWGDGSSDSELTGDATHEYDTAGIYTVSISGDFPRMFFDFGGANQIMTIEQWGDIEWASMERAFAGCDSLTYNAIDKPDLSKVTNLVDMFNGADSFNGDLNNWDVSSVQDMSSMFAGAESFNGDLDNWDVSSVQDMSAMFAGADSFNGDLNNWDVSLVQDISFMFSGAESFNKDLSNWDVSNVISMHYMFKKCSEFKGDISNWDVSNVTDMERMFQESSSFNGDLSEWDVSNVENMFAMFWKAYSFNRDISQWNISEVTNMGLMFNRANLSPNNYDKILKGWASLDSVQDDVLLDAGGAFFCESGSAREKLIKDYNWTIDDAGQNCRYQQITFNDIEDKYYSEDTFQLNATASSGLPITYTSSNEEVASISNETVIINGAGTSEITASQEGNEDYDPTEPVTRELVVLKSNQTITFDSIPPQPYWTNNFTLDAVVSSNLPVSYLSSDEKVAIIVDNNEIDLISEGKTSITAYQEGNSNYEASDSITHELLVVKNTVTAVKDIEDSNIQIYPNPTYDFIYINNVEDLKYIRLYNEEGKLIQQQKLESEEVKINIKNQLEGVYFIRLDNQKEVFKILKK